MGFEADHPRAARALAAVLIVSVLAAAGYFVWIAARAPPSTAAPTTTRAATGTTPSASGSQAAGGSDALPTWALPVAIGIGAAFVVAALAVFARARRRQRRPPALVRKPITLPANFGKPGTTTATWQGKGELRRSIARGDEVDEEVDPDMDERMAPGNRAEDDPAAHTVWERFE